MRDSIFRLNSACRCRYCGNPTDIQFLGSVVGYTIFRYWSMQNKYMNKLSKNVLCYHVVKQKSRKVCKACFLTRDITLKDIERRKNSRKYRFQFERSLTNSDIDDIWSKFINDVKTKKWLIEAYNAMLSIRANLSLHNLSVWNMLFNDVFLYYHNTDESFDVYDLEEFDTYRIWQSRPILEVETQN